MRVIIGCVVTVSITGESDYDCLDDYSETVAIKCAKKADCYARITLALKR